MTIHQAKTHLSRLVREVLEGEEIVVARGKTPLVRLVPVTGALPPRRFGTARGQVALSPDFDAQVPDFDAYG